MMTFPEKLAAIQQQKGTNRALILSPRVQQMPLPIQKYDDPFLPFGKAIVDVTRDLVCAYFFDLAAFLSIGAAGAVAMERTIAYVKGGGGALTVLDGKFATPDYAAAAGIDGFGVDAVTVARCGWDAKLLQTYSDALYEGVIFVEKTYSGVHPPPVPTAAMWSEDGREIQVMSRKLPDFVAKLRLVGNEVLYASQREDFAEQVRAALEQM